MEGNNYAAVEISNDGVKLLVGYYYEGKVYVLHALQSMSTALTNGYINDAKQITLAVKELITSAESQLNKKIDEVVLCLPPVDVIVKTETAVTSTVAADSIVRTSDSMNVLMMIRKKVVEPGKKIVTNTPYSFLLDNGQNYRTLPENLQSNSLTIEADAELIDEVIYNTYQSAVENAQVKVIQCFTAPHAAAKLLESYEQIPSQYILLDIGAKMTSMSIIVENRLLYTNFIAFGGEDIKKAVANTFEMDTEKAEKYIHVYGLQDSPSFTFKTDDGFTLEELKATIIKSLHTLVNQINSYIAYLGLEELPTFVLSGGVANLYELSDYLREVFDVSVMVFNPMNFGARNKSYVNLLGAIKCISLDPPKTFQRRVQDYTLTRVGTGDKKKSFHNDDESL